VIAHLRRLLARLANVLRPGAREGDAAREIAAHLALIEDDLVRRGRSRNEAHLEARRILGGVDQARALHRTARSISWIDDGRRDAGYAIRALRRSPGFAALAILTLALGIGASTAIFSLVYSALLRPLPYAHADRVLLLSEGQDGNAVTFGNFASWRERSHEFEALGAWLYGSATLSRDDDTTRVTALRATADVWKVLQTPPAAGRYFTQDEDRPTAAPVVVLSHHLWDTQFHDDPAVVGSSLLLDATPRTVVGVASPGFEAAGILTDLWLPAAFSSSTFAEHGDHELTVYGLIRDGGSRQAAMTELAQIEQQLRRDYPRAGLDGVVRATDLRQSIVGDTRKTLLILTAAVTFVLLIACANITSLLLARAAVRQREVAVRTALGASRGRIVAQLLMESVVLALIGGAAGVALAYAGFHVFVAAASTSLVTLGPEINGWVLLFAAAMALTCAVIFGLTPALRASRTDVQATLRDVGPRAGRIGEAARNVLVVIELVLAVVLLVGAALLVRSAMALQRVPLGFDTRDLATMRVSLPVEKYRDPAQVGTTFASILESARALPRVDGAALVSRPPFFQGANCGVIVKGRAVEGGPIANFRSASPGYFATMGLSLRAGRLFGPDDVAGSPAVTVINDTLAHRLFGQTNPVGERVALCAQLTTSQANGYEIIGVVGSMRSNGLRRDVPSEMFMPIAQSPGNWTMSLVVRSGEPLSTLAPDVRHAVRTIDPFVAVYGVQPFENLVAQDRDVSRFITQLLVALGLTGVLLATIGVYGVIAYFVSQRSHEISVRMAVGASTSRVVTHVLHQGLLLATLGIGIGTLAALAVSRLLESLLFGVSARDPATLMSVDLLLAIIALAASGIPARRAARVDPVAALRQ
jgi:putative ABC transport system permease protein